MQYVILWFRKNDWESVIISYFDYICFYNSLWLVVNDVIIGIVLGLYVIDNFSWFVDEISYFLMQYMVEVLQSSILWFMGWLVGLKFNSELVLFLGDLFLWVIEYWFSEYFVFNYFILFCY